MLSDFKYAIRQLRKSPGFAITAVLTLAIGIGMNTTIFSVMDAVVLRPLAVPDMSRMVAVAEVHSKGADPLQVSLGDYEDWVRQSRAFEGLAARTSAYLNMTGAGDAARVEAAAVSPNFFGLLRAQPLMGRLFAAGEGQKGRDGEAVLSYSFWKRQFGGEANVVGRRVELDQRAYTIIGVMPRGLAYPSTTDVFLPLATTAQQAADHGSRDYQVMGRLRAGVSVGQAQAEMRQIAARVAQAYPATNLGWSATVVPLLEEMNGTLTPLYFNMILGATGFVLLIVCANVANLQFARGLGRRSEVALRTALGAGRMRLLRQLLAESMLLGAAGAAGGLALAKLGLIAELHFMPERVARYLAGWGHIEMNGRVLALSIAAAVAAGVISGIAPALEALRVNLVEQLKAGGRTTIGSGRAHRLRNIFAVAQIALAVALVVGAALMAKGMTAMLHRSEVYRPLQVLTFDVQLPADRYGTAPQQAAWYAASLDRIRALPGVKEAAVSTYLPEGNNGTWDDGFAIEGRSIVPGQQQSAARLAVSAGYFDTLHIPIATGRGFAASDGLQTMPVAIVSRNFAARHFPGTNALGHSIRFGAAGGSAGPEDAEPWATIVGVAGDVQYEWIDASGEPAIYLDAAQFPTAGTKYVVATTGDPLLLAPEVRRALAGMDATLPLDAMQSYEGFIRESFTGLIYVAAMLGVDAAIALLLAAIGIFGVMANLVGERRREIGVRLTLGARREDVLRMFLGRAGILTGTGLAIGIVLAAGLARMVASLLFGVSPGDIAVFAATIAVIAAVALLAAYLPARRAAMVDPVESLRDE